MFSLSISERLAILAGSAGLLCVVILCTLCFVCPVCWIYKRLHYQTTAVTPSKRKKINATSPIIASAAYSGIGATARPRYNDPPPPYEHSVFHHPLELVHLNSITSISSDASIPLPQTNQIDTEFGERPGTPEQDCGTVILSIQYRCCGEKPSEIGQLKVTLKEVNDLPIRLYGSRCDPYVVVQIKKTTKNKNRLSKSHKDTPIYQYESTVQRKCQNPVFNESFSTQIELSDIPKCILKAIVWDKEKLANDTAIGEASISFKDMENEFKKQYFEEHALQLQLKESKMSNGEILLGLCYLPTAERMTVAVLKIKNLKQDPEQKQLSLMNYVQSMAIYEGKVMEKRKTSSLPSSESPVFNEMLMFDIPAAKIESITLLVTVRKKMAPVYDGALSQQQVLSRRNLCVGKVLMGSSCKKNELQHWNSMKNSPRKQIVQWHSLR